jgi:uncharacterized protein YjbI with pentapeptide repeats
MAKKIISKYQTLPTAADLTLDLTEDVEIYVVNANVTLTMDVGIITSGTAQEGMLLWIYYNGSCTVDGNTLQVLGTDISAYADEKLMIYSIYRNAGWQTTFLNLNLLSIEAGDVTTSLLAALAVTTAKLADASVTTVKIADANVTTAKILDANITTAKILDSNVTTAKILNANVTADKLASDSVTTIKILNDNVTTAKILDANVTEAKIADGAIAPNKLEQPEEVIPLIVDISADVSSGYANIPFKCTFKDIRYAILEDLDGNVNDVTLAVNVNGVVSGTVFQTILSATAGDAVRGTKGTLSSAPDPGTQVLSTGDDYVEIELTQTTNQGGKVQFFLIVDRTD